MNQLILLRFLTGYRILKAFTMFDMKLSTMTFFPEIFLPNVKRTKTVF